MNKLLNIFVIFLMMFGGNKCLGQDKMSPDYFIQLQQRTNKKIENIKLDPLLTYIRPGSNIKINFLKSRMREAIALDSSEYIQDSLALLNELKDSIQAERNSLIALAQSEEEKDKIRNKYEQQIENLVTKPQTELIKLKKEIKLTIKANITLKNGKTYALAVPNYFNVVQKGDTSIVSSITQRRLGLSSEYGLEDKIVDTEIDLIQENLSKGDILKVEIETDDDGIKRKYIKRFVLSDHGWKLEYPASVLFVKRIKEPTDSAGNEINPSDFKPAPGGSMILSYKPEAGLKNQLLKGWSVGLNVSLLDFETEKNVELGLGFIVYAFDHLIGGGYGWNLNASDKKSYYFISLDFLRTFETFGLLF